MLLEIKKYPEPILRAKAKEIKEITPEIKKLGGDMIETMLKSEPVGVGLAGPQVGAPKRIIVAQTEQGPVVFINPKITKKSREKDITEEGCLSLPGIWLKIKRAKWIEAEGLDINGNKIKSKLVGLLARVFQHEIDHLDGVLIIDRLNVWRRFKIKRTLKS